MIYAELQSARVATASASWRRSWSCLKAISRETILVVPPKAQAHNHSERVHRGGPERRAEREINDTTQPATEHHLARLVFSQDAEHRQRG